MSSPLQSVHISINSADRSIIGAHGMYGTFSEDPEQPLLPSHDPTSTSVVLPLEFIDFNETVKRYYITPYLLCIENEKRVLKEQDERLTPVQLENLASQQRVSSEVISIVENVVQYLREEGEPLFQGGELSRCGSVQEGTKVGNCDEFDYQYLVTTSNLHATRKPPLRTKPRSSSDATKSFFRLDERVGEELYGRELHAKDVHDRFKEEVARALSNQTLPYEYILKKSGPAVKIVLYEYDREHQARCVVKIDFTLGIKADPKTLYKDEELTPLARDLPWGLTLKCHFVCAHDYWKIAFVETEQELMKRVCEQDQHKMACYRAIKCIRDMVDIRDPYGDGILPSYPIKMTFLDIALKDYKYHVDWAVEDVASHTIRVLREVEERGQGHRLTSPFLLGEDIMAEADRSYLESRRILKKLKEAEEVFLKQHSLLQPFLIFTSLISYLCLIGIYCWGDPPKMLPSPYPPWLPYPAFYSSGDLRMVFFTVLPLNIIACVIGLFIKDSPRYIQPFYSVYGNVVKTEVIYVLVNVCAAVFFMLFELQVLLSLVFYVYILLATYLPAISLGATSIFLNALYALILGKNLQLYNSMLLCPLLAWNWRSLDGKCIKYVPELCDGQALNGFARVRAVIVVVLTPMAVILPISITLWLFIAYKTEDLIILLITSCVSIALICIILLLLFQQFLASTSWRKYFKCVWKMRFRNILSSTYCYPMVCCCPSVLKRFENTD